MLSGFPHATMRTSFVSASCATTGKNSLGSAMSRPPHGDARGLEVVLDPRDPDRPVVEGPGEEDRVREALPEDDCGMGRRPEPAGCDERPPDRGPEGAVQIEVVPVPRPVPIHARDEELPRAEPFRGPRPGDCVELRRPAPAVGVDTPSGRLPFRVDRDDDALSAEGLRPPPTRPQAERPRPC